VIRRLAGKIVFKPPPPLLPLLLPLSFIYRTIAAIHGWIYRKGLIKKAVLPRPVVSIGNIAVGGGGKTPLTMWLAQMLRNEGEITGVLTRGYGRSADRVVIADPEHDWRHIGDEPALMVRRIQGLPVAVSKNRRRGGEEILRKQDVDLFILDDGFGHHALHKDLEIVVIDDNRRFGNCRLLPAGMLREPVTRLRDAQIIIVTKAAQADLEFEKEIKKRTDAPVLWADYRPGRLAPVEGTEGCTPGMVPEGPFLAFCGIADPGSFRISLDRAGIQTAGILSYPDHHPYSPSDVSDINREAHLRGARTLVTTEKDAVRWPSTKDSLPCYSLAMDIVFLKGEVTLLDTVTSVVSR
jgi:tetraacyldisaccharide 4'-kinase